MIKVEPLAIPDVKLVTLRRFSDERGWFMESFRESAHAAAGLPGSYVQDNVSFSMRRGTIRGLHYQLPPVEQGKLVRVVRGAIWDVAVDIRRGSPSFGRHVAVRLDADAATMLFVPAGFAHGFCTLMDDTEVEYKVTAVYAPDRERAIRWDAPDLAIAWPLDGPPTISAKDAVAPDLAGAEFP